MTTRSLLWWVALLGGAELALRGHLWNQPALFHAGAWLVVGALGVAGWRAAGWRRSALFASTGLPMGLSLLAALGLPTRSEDPLTAFWREHAADRGILTRIATTDSVSLFGTSVALDAHGFRAQRAPAEPVYRIVAIGGSNTFGVPRPEDGPPWPALLEQEIAALGCAVPVAVFNAGRTGRGLAAAVRGFESEILPHDPDLILVYPGPADVFGLAQAAPAGIGAVLPLPERASSLLARLETGWSRRPVAKRYREALAEELPDEAAEGIPLAATYRSLLVKSRSHGIDVALATASLALDVESPESEVRRHEANDPRSRHAVLANRLHDRRVRQVGASFRAIPIDSSPGLDGAGDEAFLDLFHLNRRGRERLARNLLAGLRPKLAREPEPACPPV
jgi:lysophospholipase L1-like esterase